jgi:hypothetical protein
MHKTVSAKTGFTALSFLICCDSHCCPVFTEFAVGEKKSWRTGK